MRRQKRGAGRAFCFERLEQRVVLSAVTVTTASDAASHTGMSLRDAIAQANTDSRNGTSDTIDFAADLSGQIITLSQGQLELGSGGAGSGAIAIDGSSLAFPIAISGNNVSRVLLVDAGMNASIRALTIQSGNAVNGAGIENSGTLTMSNVAVTGNMAPFGL